MTELGHDGLGLGLLWLMAYRGSISLVSHLGFFPADHYLRGTAFTETVVQMEALIWSFMWELRSSLVSLFNQLQL